MTKQRRNTIRRSTAGSSSKTCVVSDPATGTCDICNNDFQKDTECILCDGICNRWYHKICSGLSDIEYRCVDGSDKLKWFCLDCNDSVFNKNKTKIEDLNPIVMKLIDVNQLLHEEKSSLIIQLTEEKVKNGLLEEKLTLSYEEPAGPRGASSSYTYSTAVKGVLNEEEDVPQRKKTLVIKHKQGENQNSEKTLQIIKTSVDISGEKARVKSLKKANDGSVFIQCEDLESCKIIQDSLKHKDELEVRNPHRMDPLLKILDIPKGDIDNSISKEETYKKLTDSVCIKNDLDPNLCKIKYVSKPNRYDKVYAIMQIDYKQHTELLRFKKKLYVNWTRCRIVDFVNVIRCFKCSGFNHVAKYCNNIQACTQCAEEHAYSDCPNKGKPPRCVNCAQAGQGGSTEHHTLDRRCPVFQSEEEKKKLRYEQNR